MINIKYTELGKNKYSLILHILMGKLFFSSQEWFNSIRRWPTFYSLSFQFKRLQRFCERNFWPIRRGSRKDWKINERNCRCRPNSYKCICNRWRESSYSKNDQQQIAKIDKRKKSKRNENADLWDAIWTLSFFIMLTIILS